MKKLVLVLKLLIFVGVIAVVILAVVKMSARKCTDISIKIDSENEYPAISDEYLISTLLQAPFPIVGEKLKDIHTDSISKIIKLNPFIEEIEKIRFERTTLVITVKLKEILMRVFPEKGEQFFIDKKGEILPFSPLVKEKTIVANGHIANNKTQLQKLFLLATAIDNHEFSKSQFWQIFVNAHHEFELIPTIGDQIVLVGDETNIEQKLFNLEKVFSNILIFKGLNEYSYLDARFQNRIISKK
ncbi:MAG: hypothetical protein LBU51_06965 [Bacteroidales bacterium]|jgi:cell division protein FtsQ|nr:hypothetical protein [Bacteroidales bacterium]